MKAFKLFPLVGALALLNVNPASAAAINLFEYAFNIDGAVTNGAAPAGVNMGGFNTTTGLGSVLVTLSGSGNHYVGMFVDHEIDEATNTFFNELGDAVGALGAGMSWEIDEPGYTFGDIYDNFTSSDLDGTTDGFGPEDISMALAHSFALDAGETAYINFTVSGQAPGSGFYLTQNDPNSQASIYYYTSMRIAGSGPQPTPEPATLGLLGLGLMGLWQVRRRKAA